MLLFYRAIFILGASEHQSTMVAAIDLFCGAGGLTRGLKDAGINVRVGIDIDSACKYPFETNNDASFLSEDAANLSSKTLRRYLRGDDITLLAGCAPCQPFSTYSKGRNYYPKQKWGLLSTFVRIVEEIKPTLVTMENVFNLKDHKVFHQFTKALGLNGYNIWYDIVNCENYGIPQSRKRLVLLASRIGEIELLPPTHKQGVKKKTVRDAIAKLPPLKAGDVDPSDRLHACSRLTDINLRRIRASRPGGTWRDWPKSIVAECHRRETGHTYPGVYGRMSWDSPSPTITTQCYGFGNGRFGHPDQDRAISLREAALLQTFPRDYQFIGDGDPLYFKNIGRLIGNAVPVHLGRVIGKSLIDHLNKN